jgi:hypothetical protein
VDNAERDVVDEVVDGLQYLGVIEVVAENVVVVDNNVWWHGLVVNMDWNVLLLEMIVAFVVVIVHHDILLVLVEVALIQMLTVNLYLLLHLPFSTLPTLSPSRG